MTATPRHDPAELATALGLPAPTDEQAAVIAAPPGPLVVIAGAGAGKTETMAARVVWLVANGYAEPGQVLGLTFTRKAAGQLLRRVRSRLARLAGTGLVSTVATAPAADPVTVATYHAFAGILLREHGLLLPIEPDTRLLSETELWQLAFDVVCAYPGELSTDKSPATLTSMVLRLSGQLAEHLVTTEQLRDTHVELERLVHTLAPAPLQRDRSVTLTTSSPEQTPRRRRRSVWRGCTRWCGVQRRDCGATGITNRPCTPRRMRLCSTRGQSLVAAMALTLRCGSNYFRATPRSQEAHAFDGRATLQTRPSRR